MLLSQFEPITLHFGYQKSFEHMINVLQKTLCILVLLLLSIKEVFKIEIGHQNIQNSTI